MKKNESSPYVKKPFVTSSSLLNIFLFLIFFCINAYIKIKENEWPFSSIYSPKLIASTLGAMVVYAAIGFGISYAINKKSEKCQKIKWGYFIAIAISILVLFTSIERISEEEKDNPKRSKQEVIENYIENEKALGKFISDEGEYLIAFPQKPQYSKKDVELPNVGKKTIHYNTYNTEIDAYIVYYVNIDLLNQMTEKQINNELLQVKNEVIASINGKEKHSKLFKTSTARTKDCFGLDYSADYINQNNNECIYCGRVLIVKDRLYSIAIVTIKDDKVEKKVNDFINSFNTFY